MNQIQKYIWLIETIKRAGKISLQDISRLYRENKDLSDDQPLSRTKFNRWRQAIFSMGINIACQRSGGYLYYIDSESCQITDHVKRWLFETFSVSNTIRTHLSIRDRIIVGDTPSGHAHLPVIVSAMAQSKMLRICYDAFERPREEVTVEPYCVKLFNERWYLMACNTENGHIIPYALDRMKDVELLGKPFELPADFNPTEYFSKYYGVWTCQEPKPERIVVRAFGHHRRYFETLPLHPSQKKIADTEAYADFEFYIVPSFDFLMKMLHCATAVEVLEPASLREKMKKTISQMSLLYDEKREQDDNNR